MRYSAAALRLRTAAFKIDSFYSDFGLITTV